jgi:hypothetical protein
MQATQPIMITKRDLQDIVAESVESGVGRAFTRLGIDHEDPLEMQYDFRHLRASRETVNAIKSHSLKVLTTAVVGGLLAYLLMGFAGGDTIEARPKLTQEQLGAAIVQMYSLPKE